MRLISKILLIFVLWGAFSEIAKADPIRITGGTSSLYYGSSGVYSSFVGNGLQLEGFTLFSNYDFPPCIAKCNPAGATVNLSSQGFTGDPAAYPPNSYNFATYLGNQYAIENMNLTFLTDWVTIDSNTLGASTNFTMTGAISLKSLSLSVPDTILQIFGSGNSRIYYLPDSNGTYGLGLVEYRYNTYDAPTSTPTPEPVPEPATIILLGTGLAGIFGYAKRKRKLNKVS